MHKTFQLRVSWWNTSLNPPVKKKDVVVHASNTQVGVVLSDLLLQNDLVFVGEFSDNSVAATVLQQRPGWLYQSLTDNLSSGLKMNMGVFYRKSKCKAITNSDLESFIHTVSIRREAKVRKYRVGVRARVHITQLESIIDFYVVHWRNYAEANSDFRKDTAAISLCNYINMESDVQMKMCLGDFNVEPWASSLAKLCSSRSSLYVKEFGGFYNPFWDFLTEENGSLSYPEHDRILAKFPMFDQILLHHGFWDLYDVLVQSSVDKKHDAMMTGRGWHRPIGVTITFNDKEK